jgi:hypothetical protein
MNKHTLYLVLAVVGGVLLAELIKNKVSAIGDFVAG